MSRTPAHQRENFWKNLAKLDFRLTQLEYPSPPKIHSFPTLTLSQVKKFLSWVEVRKDIRGINSDGKKEKKFFRNKNSSVLTRNSLHIPHS